jgi:hypothetical protein
LDLDFLDGSVATPREKEGRGLLCEEGTKASIGVERLIVVANSMQNAERNIMFDLNGLYEI